MMCRRLAGCVCLRAHVRSPFRFPVCDCARGCLYRLKHESIMRDRRTSGPSLGVPVVHAVVILCVVETRLSRRGAVPRAL